MLSELVCLVYPNYEQPHIECPSSTVLTNGYLPLFAANHLVDLGRVDLCCTNFGLNGSVLIANQLCRPSGLSQRAVTKSKMLP